MTRANALYLYIVETIKYLKKSSVCAQDSIPKQKNNQSTAVSHSCIDVDDDDNQKWIQHYTVSGCSPTPVLGTIKAHKLR